MFLFVKFVQERKRGYITIASVTLLSLVMFLFRWAKLCIIQTEKKLYRQKLTMTKTKRQIRRPLIATKTALFNYLLFNQKLSFRFKLVFIIFCMNRKTLFFFKTRRLACMKTVALHLSLQVSLRYDATYAYSVFTAYEFAKSARRCNGK